MKTGRTTLALAVVVLASLGTSDLRAQDLAPPPASSSATAQGGTNHRAKNVSCLYDSIASIAALLNISSIAPETQDLWNGFSGGVCGSGGTQTLTLFDVFGRWGTMLSLNAPKPERVSRETVKAAWDASRKDAAEGPALPPRPTPPDRTEPDELEAPVLLLREGHAAVPRIGDGYGSAALASRSLEFRVAPEPKPASYNVIPIVERGRFWERVETSDGRRVWRQSDPDADPYRGRMGADARNIAKIRSRAAEADPQVRWPAGMRPTPGSTGSVSRSSLPSPSAESSSSETQTETPRGKKVKQ